MPKPDERDSSESEENELEIDDALLDQMLWKAERLANEMKLLAETGGGGSQQRDSCSETSSGSQVNPCYSTVPNSIELDRSQEDAGTECSSVGCWLHTQEFRSDVATLAEDEETGVNEMDKTSERSTNVMTPEKLRNENNSQPDQDEEMESSSKQSRDNSSCNSINHRNIHSLATQADADISAALKAAHLMKMQLEAVLIDSSQSGGSEENMDSSTSEEEDHNFDDGDVLSVDHETHASSALEALTPEQTERMGHSAAKQLTVPKQIAEDDTVPIADYTRTKTVKPVFEKVIVAAVGDQDYVPIQDYSMASNKRGVPLREFTFSENHAVVIRKRRFRRRQRRLAVLALFFVTVVGLLLSRRLWGAVPTTAPEARLDPHEMVDHQSPMPTTIETSNVAQEVGEASEVVAQLKEIQDSDDALCLLPFSSVFSGSCRSSMHLKSAPDKARARAKRREAVENLLQIMME